MRRALQICKQSAHLVPPRVSTAALRALFNGRCCARRFQMKKSCCLLGCANEFAEDSIEHYAHCPIVREFASRKLKLGPHLVGNICSFLRLNRGVGNDERTLQLLLLHCVYSATDLLRFNRPILDIGCVHELLLQCMHQGANNCSNAQQILREALTPNHVKRHRLDHGLSVATTRPSASTLCPTFTQGGDHFMTTSFPPTRLPPEEISQTWEEFFQGYVAVE